MPLIIITTTCTSSPSTLYGEYLYNWSEDNSIHNPNSSTHVTLWGTSVLENPTEPTSGTNQWDQQSVG